MCVMSVPVRPTKMAETKCAPFAGTLSRARASAEEQPRALKGVVARLSSV